MGTYHDYGGMQILDSIKAFDSVFYSANQLVCEIDIKKTFKRLNKSDSKKLNNRQLKPWPVADSTYENLLSDNEKTLLDSVVGSFNLSKILKKLNLRPIQLMSYLQYSFKKKDNGNDLEDSDKKNVIKGMLDWHIQNLAGKRKIKIVELDSGTKYEKIQDSISALIPQLSYRKEVDMLIFYIENYKQINSIKEYLSSTMLQAYLKQEISFSPILNGQQIEKINQINKSIQFYLGNQMFLTERNRLIIDERNKYWMKKIPDLINETSCFIAIGAGHLGGEKGIINQLRELGYNVVRV